MNRDTENVDYDIIVVGGGPAGCAFVRTLINHGSNLRILLVDKDRFPRDKICGDGLTYQAIPLVGEIFPELAKLTPSESFTARQVLWYPHGRKLIREGLVLDVIPRVEFDNALWQATQSAGANTLENATILGVLKKDGRVQGVSLRDENGPRELTCRLLVGADGSRSIVRRETGSTENDQVIYALRQYVRGIPDSNDGLIFHFDVEHRGYFWIFPFIRKGERWANVGYGNSTNSRILKERFAHYCRTPEMQTYLGDGHFEENITGFSLNLARFKWNGRLSRRLFGEGYFLLGDAAALIHPLTGEGISFALESGRLAAEVLIDKSISPKRTGEVYERRLLRRVRPSFLSLAEFCAIRLPSQLPRVLSRALVSAAQFAQTRLGLGIRPLKRQDVRGNAGNGQNESWFRTETILLFLLVAALSGFWIVRAIKPAALPAPYAGRAHFFTALATTFCVLDARRKYNPRFALSFLAVVFIFALGIELLGSLTGIVFGTYHYETTMPLQVFGLVPLVIPFFWFVLSYLTFETAAAILPKDSSILIHSLMATGLLVAWDLVSDPNHVYRGGWVFPGGGMYYGIPIQNFVAWAVLGFLIFFVLGLVRPPETRSAEASYLPLAIVAFTAVILHEGFFALLLAGHRSAAAIAFSIAGFIWIAWFYKQATRPPACNSAWISP